MDLRGKKYKVSHKSLKNFPQGKTITTPSAPTFNFWFNEINNPSREEGEMDYLPLKNKMEEIRMSLSPRMDS